MPAPPFFTERVADVQRVIQRARSVFVISNLAAIVIVAAQFNLYLSWFRHAISRVDPKEKELIHAIHTARIEDLRMISIPLIGLKFAAVDIGVISSLAMIVLSIWLYYTFRREQHSVGRLILEVSNATGTSLKVRPGLLEYASYLLFALSTTFVFVTSGQQGAIGDCAVRVNHARKLGHQVAQRVLLWSPFWTVLLCALVDVATLFFPSSLFSQDPHTSLWQQMQHAPGQRTEAMLRTAFTVSMSFVIFLIMRRALYYSDWTQRMYRYLGYATREAEESNPV
jgi:hypothetical protein